MIYLIGLLTVVLVLDCVVLVFLVLLQLPKKEAGAGLAFGGGATDALFGAGAGNVLTKITKYSATIFFVLALLLSVLQSRMHARDASGSDFEKRLKETPAAAAAADSAAPVTSSTTKPSLVPASAAASNAVKALLSAEDTNTPAKPAPVVTPPPSTKP